MGKEQQGSKRASVLLVDDDDRIRSSVAQILSQAGYEVVEAANARAAAALIQGRGIDVVLTDIFMPEGDGFELINEIRRQERNLPVIVMSGGGEQVHGNFLEFAGHLGAVASLQKPFTPRQLFDALDAALAGA